MEREKEKERRGSVVSIAEKGQSQPSVRRTHKQVAVMCFSGAHTRISLF